MAAVEQPVQMEFELPTDRFGNRATKLVLLISNWEPRLTIEDDIETFTGLKKKHYVKLSVYGYIEDDNEFSKSTEDGEERVQLVKSLKVSSVEIQ